MWIIYHFRFSKENRHKIHPASWLPFGNGPRSCLGMRLALMEIKFAVVRILQEFRYEKCPETEVEFLHFVPFSSLSQPSYYF